MASMTHLGKVSARDHRVWDSVDLEEPSKMFVHPLAPFRALLVMGGRREPSRWVLLVPQISESTSQGEER